MIGMVNVQCDSPMDFYATPRRKGSQKIKAPAEIEPVDVVNPKQAVQRMPSYRPLFFRKNIEKLTYTADGRKMSNGEVIEKQSPNKLWEELLLRSFAHKIEDEIPSPVEGFKTFSEGFAMVRGLDRTQSSSTYSLVSDYRAGLESAEYMDASDIEECKPEDVPRSTEDMKRKLNSVRHSGNTST